MKFLTSFCLIASLATFAWAASASWGRRNSSDFLLLRENVVRTPIKNNNWSVNVNFPKSGQVNKRVITAIFVYDRFKNTSGAMPSLWSGGPNMTFATVNLKSQISRGMNSTVEIYGK
uniref:Putative salivary secreted peptide n=1 Tax=Haematobia irritans TaxID=7368 RepID=A0A1L8EHP3_HAEIR